jgi:hypothetical protein
LLLLQLKLRSDTEPYPAILLPAGATLLRGDGSYTGFETECSAEDTSGKQYDCNLQTLLAKVPTNYREFVLQAGFGTAKERVVRHLRIPFTGYSLEIGRPRTQAQLDTTRAWLRSRLRRTLGIDPLRVHIRRYAITTFYNSNPVREQKRLQHETLVDLREEAR